MKTIQTHLNDIWRLLLAWRNRAPQIQMATLFFIGIACAMFSPLSVGQTEEATNGHTNGQTTTSVAPKHYKTPQLRVGMAGSAPFVTSSADGKPAGITLDVWDEIAQQAGIEYTEPYRYPSVKAGIEAIQSGQLDILIGPITINATRAKIASFSQPYYRSDVGIVGKRRNVTIWQRIKPFFSYSFIYAVGMLLLVLLVLGVLLYWAERKHNQEFKNGAVRGVLAGLWLSLQTMNTTGYGDYAPRTLVGRTIMGAWMILSLILSTSLIAGIASTLALSAGQDNSYKELADLRGLRVATSGYSKLVSSIRANSAMPVTVKNVEEGMQLLRDGKVQAVVYDLVQLQYAMRTSDHEQFVLNVNNQYPQDYGFVFPQDSALRADLDVYMLNLREKDAIQQAVDEWVIRAQDGDKHTPANLIDDIPKILKLDGDEKDAETGMETETGDSINENENEDPNSSEPATDGTTTEGHSDKR